MNIFELFLLL